MLCLAPANSFAADFPSKTVSIVVPGGAGGSFDVLARILAQRLNEKWKTPVIVENRGGGGGNIGAAAVKNAAPDGYTLLLWNDQLLINPLVLADTPFDAAKDFTPLSLAVFVPNVLAVHPKLGIDTFEGYLQLAREQPGKTDYGSPGMGTPGHLSFELLKQVANIDVQHIPYKGAGPAITDAVAGQMPVIMVGVAGAIGHVRSGSLKALAVTSEKRIKGLPDVPTIAEKGLPNYRINAWYGIFGPSGMDAAVASKLERDINDVLKEPDIVSKLTELGFDPIGGTASQMKKIMEDDLPTWKGLVEKAGVGIGK